MRKGIIIALIVVCVGILILYYYRNLFFTGVFDKKYTREELTANFIKHEDEFQDLLAAFCGQIPGDKNLMISLGKSKGEKVSLTVRPFAIDAKNKVIGGEDLMFDSPALDSALVVLGWTKQTLKDLKDKLSNTNCDWIRTTEIYGRPIELYPNQKGWSSYSYHVFDAPLPDSLKPTLGKPISDSKLGSRVVLIRSSAL